jgi:hypothetical protein
VRPPLALACLVLASPPAARAGAGEVARARAPSAREFDEALPEGESLTGREIYRRFLHNRYRESFQRLRVISRDPGGSEQESRLRLSVKDYRGTDGEPRDGIHLKLLVQIDEPFDMRHTAYLMIAREPGPHDEFVYRPESRTVRRVDLRRTSLLGTDYSFRDIGFQDIDDADYARHPDEVVDGRPVYVIEARAVDGATDAEYHRTLVYLDQEHYVPLRARYWDEFGVEAKELRAPAAGLRAFGDVWVATESTMLDLRQQTSSTLLIDAVDTEPGFGERVFSVRSLTRGR